MVEYSLMKESFIVKRAAFADFVRTDAHQHAVGEKPTLATAAEIAVQTGYSVSHAKLLMTKMQLAILRKKAQQEFESLPLSPSAELAWFVGYTAGASKRISSTLIKGEHVPELREKYRAMGQAVFKKKPNSAQQEDARKHSIVVFSDEVTVARLGDLSRQGFAKTFFERYSWTQSPEYIWHLINGLFDERASINKNDIRLHIKAPSFARLIQNLLMQAGVEKPIPIFYKNGDYAAICIKNIRDRRFLAANLELTNPENVEELRTIATSERKRGEVSEEDLLPEWQEVRELLGRPVRMVRIKQLREQGILTLPFSSYTRVFGDGGNRKTAESLNALASLYEGFYQGKKLDIISLKILADFARKPYVHAEIPEALNLLGQKLRVVRQIREFSYGLKTDRQRLSRYGINAAQISAVLDGAIEEVGTAETAEDAIAAIQEVKKVAKLHMERVVAQVQKESSYTPAQQALNQLGRILFGIPDSTRIIQSFTQEKEAKEADQDVLQELLAHTQRAIQWTQGREQLNPRLYETLRTYYVRLGAEVFGRSDITLITHMYLDLKNGEKPLEPAQGK